MNYYDLQSFGVHGSGYGLLCCGIGEAVIGDYRDVLESVEKNILGALQDCRGILIWTVVESIKQNREALPIVEGLPATKHVVSFKNPRTKRIIHMFITNLKEEW